MRMLRATYNRAVAQAGQVLPPTVSNFTDPYRLVDPAEISKGGKTIWIPANVRGTSLAAISPIHRTKKNAPIAASYLWKLW